MAFIDPFLSSLVETGGSDLHLAAGRPPRLRLHGTLHHFENYPPLNPDQMREMIREITPPRVAAELEQSLDVDFAYAVEGVGRFRVNVFNQLDGLAAVFRRIPTVIPSADDLNLPNSIRELAGLHRGLVLVTGPTGSGKSTTLAAIINIINRTRSAHILTIEDPIEFVHPELEAHVSQREVGQHAADFKRALRAALREDPDVILVGELRDYETMELASTAAETGHLVLGTMHTNSAAKSLDRIIAAFPADGQNQIRSQLSTTLKAIIAQQLIPRADGQGRLAAFEILKTTPGIANMLRQGKTDQITDAMRAGSREGMVSMDQSLADLYLKRLVTEAAAMSYAHDAAQFRTYARLPAQGQL